jgi:hypothetical protein
MSIVEHFEALESERRTNIENLGKLRQLKHGLMYDLLAGHVRVPGAKEIEQREVEADVRSHPR